MSPRGHISTVIGLTQNKKKTISLDVKIYFSKKINNSKTIPIVLLISFISQKNKLNN